MFRTCFAGRDVGASWPKSITISPPTTRNRTLAYIGVPKEAVHVGYSPEALEELYGVSPQEAEEALGPNWIDLDNADALRFLERFEAFMTLTLEARAAEQAKGPIDPA